MKTQSAQKIMHGIRATILTAFLANMFTVMNAQNAAQVAKENLTPQSLFRWVQRGTTPIVSGSGIQLPAQSEFSRSFEGNVVTVELTSRPYFGVQPVDWAMLSVGSATLTFARDEAGGGLVLVGNDLIPLPKTIALSADGYSQEKLTLTLSLDRIKGEATLTLKDGGSASVSTETLSRTVAVIFSTGETAPWLLENLAVTAPLEHRGKELKVAENPLPVEQTGKKVVDEENLARIRRDSFEAAKTFYHGKRDVDGEVALFSSAREVPGTVGWYVEAAGKLTHVALALRREYNYPQAIAVAQRALAFLKEAEKLARNAKASRQASIHEMAGFIQDELLRDAESAKSSYQRAKQLSPTSKRAEGGLKKLEDEAQASKRFASKP